MFRGAFVIASAVAVIGTLGPARAEIKRLKCSFKAECMADPKYAGKKCNIHHPPTNALVEMDFDKNKYRALFTGPGNGGGTFSGDMNHVDDEKVVLVDRPMKDFNNKVRLLEISRLSGSFLLRDPFDYGYNLYRGTCATTTETLPEKKF